MKTLSVFTSFILCCIRLYCQDGSDIHYLKKMDKSLIGDTVQLDFYRKSFAGLNTDTIIIGVKGKAVKFVEIRNDDGFNNWYAQQYLESVDDIDGFKVKINDWKVLDVSKDSIVVIPNVSPIFPKPTGGRDDLIIIDKCSFPKSIIAEVLVKAKQL